MTGVLPRLGKAEYGPLLLAPSGTRSDVDKKPDSDSDTEVAHSDTDGEGEVPLFKLISAAPMGRAPGNKAGCSPWKWRCHQMALELPAGLPAGLSTASQRASARPPSRPPRSSLY